MTLLEAYAEQIECAEEAYERDETTQELHCLRLAADYGNALIMQARRGEQI